jgi:hypothetical protein
MDFLKSLLITIPALLTVGVASIVKIRYPELAPVVDQVLAGLGIAAPSLLLVPSPLSKKK